MVLGQGWVIICRRSFKKYNCFFMLPRNGNCMKSLEIKYRFWTPSRSKFIKWRGSFRLKTCQSQAMSLQFNALSLPISLLLPRTHDPRSTTLHRTLHSSEPHQLCIYLAHIISPFLSSHSSSQGWTLLPIYIEILSTRYSSSSVEVSC